MNLAFNPNNPIPNGPFFYPDQWSVAGPLGPFIVGTNLSVDPVTGTLNATPPGGGNVTSITAGTGLTGGTITSTGTIALAPTGVAPGNYTAPNLTLNALGQIVAIASNTGIGTVCCIVTGTGLTGGPITNNGTIAIAPTAVVPGAYPFACISVNAQGQIISATSCAPVTAVTAGVGLNGGTITSTGTINLANTGVTVGCYCNPTMCVDAQGRISNIVSNNVVTCITTGNGLIGGPITTNGQIALTNTGVLAGPYTLPNVTVDLQGRITAISNGSAVTQIFTGTGLTGGPITNTGTIALGALSPTSAGSYTFASLNVDAYGRVSSASSGSLCTAISGLAPITVSGSATAINVGINSASTSAPGAVTLTDNTNTNSAATALTAAQGYSLQQQINALTTALSNLTLAGTFDASAAVMLTVTTCGTAEGFVVGSDAPAPDPLNENSFFVVVTPGTYSPPGGGTYSASQGDWFLSNGTVWQWLNLGYDPSLATTLDPGVIQIATLSEVQAGTDATKAVTSDTLAQSYVPNSCYVTKGDLLVGDGASSYTCLPVATGDGYPIISCSTAPTGLAYGPLPINQNILTTKGDVIVADNAGAPTRFALGTTGQVLTVDTSAPLGVSWCSSTVPIPLACVTDKGVIITGSAALTAAPLASSFTDGDLLHVCNACSTGLCWGPLTGYIPCSIFTGKGDIITATGAGNPIALNPGTDGYVLAACSTAGNGLTWLDRPPAIPCSCITGKGVIISGTAANSPATLAAGTDGQYLTACALCANGLYWQTPPATAIPCSCITAKGTLITGTAADTPVALPVGTDGTILYANSACSSGLEWVCYVPAIPCACLTAKGSIISATASATPAATAVGMNNQVLTACSACPTGLTWSTPTADIPCSILTAKGSLITATAANAPVALPVGADWTTLVSCSACANGVTWATYGVGPWVNAGFIEQVGWNSTGGVPILVGTWTRNNVSYRRLGRKDWEVVYSFYSLGAAVNAGSGDYLFTLPNGLSFDTNLNWQLPWQGYVGVADYLHSWFVLPGQISSSIIFTDNSNASIYGAGVAPWDATRFRFIVSDSNQTRPRAMGSAYYDLNALTAFKFAFRFTST
jgi:hypothetical protein